MILSMLVPALIFPLELYLCMDHPRFAWLRDWRQYPWELWAITVFGTAATVGGAADWLFHRSGETAVGKKEHRAHLMALAGGGVPLFVLMSAASLSRRPTDWLMPVLIIVMATVVMISYDEFVFHRRIQPHRDVHAQVVDPRQRPGVPGWRIGALCAEGPMRESLSTVISAANLLRRASALYDQPENALAAAAPEAWRGGFASGERWMREAMQAIRGTSPGAETPQHQSDAWLNWLGLAKYCLATGTAVMVVAVAGLCRRWEQ